MGTSSGGHLERKSGVRERTVHRDRIHRLDRSVRSSESRKLSPKTTHPSGSTTRIILILDARIEHLHDEELSKFAPILLGVYHPRLLLITTPSYTFNARFAAPAGSEQSMPSDEDSKIRDGGYLDPTRRTSRVFRHPDHKFEWTIREFEEWCTTTARKWGYTVHTSGIGKPLEEDGWGRDSELGYATQTAVFTRLDGDEHERSRSENARAYLHAPPGGAKLLATHLHAPHHTATSPPQSNEVIIDLIKKEIDRGEENKILLRYLWIEEEICCACSGRIGVLIDATKSAEDSLRLHVTDPGAREDWVVELIGSSKRRKENLWEDQQNETVETHEEISDEEIEGELGDSEVIEWGNDDSGVDVIMEPEETATSTGWGAWASSCGGWGSQVNEHSHGGWGTIDYGSGDPGWGGEDEDSS